MRSLNNCFGFPLVYLFGLAIFTLITSACNKGQDEPQTIERKLIRVERNGLLDTSIEYDEKGRQKTANFHFNNQTEPDVIRSYGHSGDLVMQIIDRNIDDLVVNQINYTYANDILWQSEHWTYDRNGLATGDYFLEYQHDSPCGRTEVKREDNTIVWLSEIYEYHDANCSFDRIHLSESGDTILWVRTKVDDAVRGYVFEPYPILSPFHGNILERTRLNQNSQIDSANSYSAELTYDSLDYLIASELTYLNGKKETVTYFYD